MSIDSAEGPPESILEEQPSPCSAAEDVDDNAAGGSVANEAVEKDGAPDSHPQSSLGEATGADTSSDEDNGSWQTELEPTSENVPTLLGKLQKYRARNERLKKERLEIKDHIQRQIKEGAKYEHACDEQLHAQTHLQFLLEARYQALEVEKKDLHDQITRYVGDSRFFEQRAAVATERQEHSQDARVHKLMDMMMDMMRDIGDKSDEGQKPHRVLELAKEVDISGEGLAKELQEYLDRLTGVRALNRTGALRLSMEQQRTKKLHDAVCELQSRLMGLSGEVPPIKTACQATGRDPGTAHHSTSKDPVPAIAPARLSMPDAVRVTLEKKLREHLEANRFSEMVTREPDGRYLFGKNTQPVALTVDAAGSVIVAAGNGTNCSLPDFIRRLVSSTAGSPPMNCSSAPAADTSAPSMSPSQSVASQSVSSQMAPVPVAAPSSGCASGMRFVRNNLSPIAVRSATRGYAFQQAPGPAHAMPDPPHSMPAARSQHSRDVTPTSVAAPRAMTPPAMYQARSSSAQGQVVRVQPHPVASQIVVVNKQAAQTRPVMYRVPVKAGGLALAVTPSDKPNLVTR